MVAAGDGLPGGARVAAATALLLVTAVSVEAAKVNSITPRHVGFGGGEIAILGSDFAEDQYSQFQPELGNIVNFVNDWDTVPCKVNVYKTSRSRIVCTVGPVRSDRGLGNWYGLHLTVDGQRVNTGWSIVYHDHYTPRVESVEPAAGPPGSLVTLRGRFFTDRYSIDTRTASDLAPSDVSIAWIRVGREDCDPVYPSTGELYGLTSDTITCRTSAAFAGPLSAQVMVTGRGLSVVKNNKRLVSSQNTIYDFLAVPRR
ncbi:fibrocystin-L-like [Amphibalanus amphitrite]|uniref:fibrocystin-L-like n=1 Tax=Amphibalanus amphitrite TaxID=1232801 RepID=UPI001C90555C|nr:fibrocystin-L-like [Amphibalanus amphitrite]